VAFVYMGMSAFDQLGRLVASNINNHLTTAYDPSQTYSYSRITSVLSMASNASHKVCKCERLVIYVSQV
jgi:hypothetical protein